MTGWHQFREDWLNKWAMCIRAKKKTNKTSHKRENRPNVKTKTKMSTTKNRRQRGRAILRTNDRKIDSPNEERTNERTNAGMNRRASKRTNEGTNERASERANERANLAGGGGGGGGRRRTVEKAYKWIEKASVQVANKLNEPLTLLTTSQPSEWVTHETTEVRKLLKTEKNVVGWLKIQTNQIEK